MIAAVAISIVGMALHTVREFGPSGVVEPATGFLPIAAVQGVLLGLWLWSHSSRRWATTALLITGVFQLVGGAIISVLPLPVLPFVPEQTFGHYLSHLLLGVAQIPLIVVPLRVRRGNLTQVASPGDRIPR